MSASSSSTLSFPLLHLPGLVRALPILPTPYGLLLIMVFSAVLVGALNYENNLGLILAFLLMAMQLTSLLQVRRSLSDLTAHIGEKPPLFAGKSNTFEVILRNSGDIHLRVQVNVAGNQPVTAQVSPGRQARIRLPIRPENRGWLSLDSLEAATVSPFGLWRLRRTMDLPGRLLVYPKPLAGPFRSTTAATGIEGDRLDGSGVDDFSGLRPYMPGDLMQRIAWKASSRGQGLFTKEFGRLVGGELHFDLQSAGPGDVETRLSRLCHLVLTARARQLSYSLSLPGETIPAGSGEPHGYRCLRGLALFQEKEQDHGS